ncbi:MAG: nucleotide pyrophosphohydrolase [Methanomicrobiales archaeon]
MNTNPWDLKDELETLHKFRKERNWEQYHRPKELATAISIESAELQELFLWKESESAEQIKENSEYLNKISDEIADIMIYLLYLADDLEINLSSVIKQKISKNELKYRLC